MRSFKVILIRNFVGMLFVILLIVFLLFNILTNNFISTEASRELNRSLSNIEGSTARFTLHPLGEPEVILLQMRQVGSLRQLMMNTDIIIISENNETVSLNNFLPEEEKSSEIIFLADYFIANRHLFEDGLMIRVSDAENTYYLTAYTATDEPVFSVLLYTDITSAVMFMRRINSTLRALLIVSGILSVLAAVLISSNVQKAILRLCNHAEVIGSGNFTEKVEGFDYREFNYLAQSMNNMSGMLNSYENNRKMFFQNVSHELRTPLMSIQGYAEGILTDVINKDEAAPVILSECVRMETLVQQLLYVSRMDSGLDVPNITSFDLKNMLYDSAERIKFLANKSGKEIVLDFPSREINMKSDEEKLQRAIDNILSNCIRHAETKVRVAYIEFCGNVKITIEDDGDGIRKEDLPHIFERFYKGVNGNSGLGLAICRDIIKKLGGSVTAENIYGNGENALATESAQHSPMGARFVVMIPVGGCGNTP
ncbi:MAG: HAMP domain-containing histidine kinase [Defluviitaleaceae bacterium]|nr:HAMP domain-containing histidine kinase [Defluviitaleaceae bacterium]